jgi:SUMO ligase MMS21 Smc5/6 complex component
MVSSLVPVLVPRVRQTCGHTFERQGILDHLKTCQRVGNPAVCPTCRQPINKEEQKKLGVNKVGLIY